MIRVKTIQLPNFQIVSPHPAFVMNRLKIKLLSFRYARLL